jgi:anhydro-N-acetylmuramic acid kinase
MIAELTQPAARRTQPNRPQAYVGLMSGTSLDGISATVARFHPESDDRFTAEMLAFISRPYTPDQRKRLERALSGGSPSEYTRLGFDLGSWFADAAIAVIAEAGIARQELRAIGSHGQTVWHEPGHSTWQIGESAVVAERTGIDVINDFRVGDIAAGGQGAPLVPIADALLFSSATQWRALQNIGGIGNVGIVPPGGVLASLRAFDTGPGVAVIDGVVRRLFPDLPFDEDGRLARRGKAIPDVVRVALEHPYFAAEPPKSTGRELFTPDYIETFMASCRQQNSGATPEDIIATAVELTAMSIADAYRRFMPEPVSEVLVSGGGGRNPVLVDRLRELLAPRKVLHFDEVFFDGEAKESVAFALLAHLHVSRRPGNIPGATGARGFRVLGKLTPGASLAR